ncbi:LysR family transcriptional regulator [Longispora albida]|uniref:LysR family transcriptional regulator n=1 Tax=Longispora albida TaxID=203523 RepID=UPI0003720C1F|nr:LysR family transcriptional regulator [Longispora albida]
MDTRLLKTLVELDCLGTMRAVAEATGYGTSAISLQLAALEKEVGAELLERSGRGVQFTPAGRTLAEHAKGILSAVEAARAAVRANAEPSGLLRVAAFASALSGSILPVVRELAVSHPDLRVELQEREPVEVTELLATGRVDLGFVYDYCLVPKLQHNGDTVVETCATPLVLAVPAGRIPLSAIDSPAQLSVLAGWPWVVNSRGEDDAELASRICALAGFAPRIAHRADSLGLVLDLVGAGLGVSVVPGFVAPREDVSLLPMPGVDARRRMFAVTRPGRQSWPAVALMTRRVTEYTGVQEVREARAA